MLEKQVAELIAAGEVVERPSSVIKELVENAVDAGATVVTVEIRRGGSSYMRVTDNGCGIAPEEAPTAFLRHATSKINTQEDLDAIGTLGFRGEALAAISAVGRIELLTRTADRETGLRYTCGGEEPPTKEEAGCPQGTTIVVRDLFFNTPARMKFLKKDVTEGNSVAGILDKVALSHPEISFRFIRDGKEQLHTPGDGKLSSAVYAVYGKEFFSTLIPVDYVLGGVRVWGYVSKPAGSRANRSMQSFFINGRYIRSRTAGAALEEACKGSVMVGKFPACVLHMQVALGAVDVNVHPAKMEIRFANERPIFDGVYHAVKSALLAGDSPKAMGLVGRKPLLPTQPPLEKAEQLPLGMAEPEISVPRLHGSFRDSAVPARQLASFDDALLHILDAPPQPVAPALPRPLAGERTGGQAGPALGPYGAAEGVAQAPIEKETAYPFGHALGEDNRAAGFSAGGMAVAGPQAPAEEPATGTVYPFGHALGEDNGAAGLAPAGGMAVAGPQAPAEESAAGTAYPFGRALWEDNRAAGLAPAGEATGLAAGCGPGAYGAAEEAPQAPTEKKEGPDLGAAVQPGFYGRIIGEAFGTYIIVEHSPRELMLIDKHAAHERLLYEKLKAQELGRGPGFAGAGCRQPGQG